MIDLIYEVSSQDHIIIICHYPQKFDDHRHFESRDTFLICQTVLHNMFKGLCYLMGGGHHLAILLPIGYVQVVI